MMSIALDSLTSGVRDLDPAEDQFVQDQKAT